MLQLLADKDAIRFTDGKRIDLRLLKNQIDRRILKITALASNVAPLERPKTDRYCRETSCQASMANIDFSIQLSKCSDRALTNLNGNDVHAHQDKRQKLKYSDKNQRSSYLILVDSEIKLNVNNSIELTKADGKTQTYKRQQIDKQGSIDHSDDNCELNLDFSNIKFDQNISYEYQANELKNYIRNTFSNRKKASMTDRSKAQFVPPTKTQRIMTRKPLEVPQIKIKEVNRILFSNNCLQKIQSELDLTINQKRQYQTDYKARSNLLKKIQQKYKNDIM